MTETTALGAAYLAGLAVGFWHRRQATKFDQLCAKNTAIQAAAHKPVERARRSQSSTGQSQQSEAPEEVATLK